MNERNVINKKYQRLENRFILGISEYCWHVIVIFENDGGMWVSINNTNWNIIFYYLTYISDNGHIKYVPSGTTNRFSNVS